MFGQPQDDQQPNGQNPQDPANNTVPGDAQAVAPSAPEAGDPAVATPAFGADPSAPAEGNQEWQHPGTPLDDQAAAPIADVISPAGGFPKAPSFPSVPDDAPQDAPVDPLPQPASDSGDQEEHHEPPVLDENTTHQLIDLKQHALEELEPLVDKLDQTSEERFRTLMMMVQATDDQSLVSKAYEAAHAIEDEKIRAQALLDVVNEINYFTQPHQDA